MHTENGESALCGEQVKVYVKYMASLTEFLWAQATQSGVHTLLVVPLDVAVPLASQLARPDNYHAAYASQRR